MPSASAAGAFQVTHDPAQDRPLALEHPAQAPVLSGVGVAAGPPLEAAAFLLEGLAQHHASPFGDQHQLAPGHVEQPAVGGKGDGLLLHRGIDDDPLQVLRGNGLHRHRGLDGLGQEFFHARVPQRTTEARQAARVAGQPGLEILAAAKELPIGFSAHR
jgi:hypothetical protein